ncbi:MAG: glucose-1-phosphate cytidylyltransferase [Gammaproteobacteria bacterium]|nr:glucose-1-phosphate cytidylyltransferase [Gammaproteobacteria bacterium]
MKVAILAGGYGTRLAEETEIRPKPMVEIGGKPILWHLMMHYYHYGYKDFVIALGYKGDYIKRWMKDYSVLNGHMVVKIRSGEISAQERQLPDWTVELVETGPKTLTGGRIKRLQPWVGNETFMLTWGDGVSDVDLNKLLAFHRSHGKLATMTAVRPQARYGHLEFDGDRVMEFNEKPQTSEGWINGAFFVLEPKIFDYIEGDDIMWEQQPLERLAADGQLMAYRHTSFWQCMDTLREKHLLEKMWQKGNPPWKTWE